MCRATEMCQATEIPGPKEGSSSLVSDAGFRVEPLSVHWRSLRVELKGRDALRSCSGDVAPGTMLAVMGPSGGGKTTLINALSRRGPVSAGRVRYGGVRGESWSPGLKRRVALVDQDDQVLSALTVGETLRYGAALRLSHLPPAERAARVAALVATLRLGACESTRVGDSSSAATRGISGGERKRLCIACELLTLPSLLFCDEPSSGLDSSMAFVVVDVLRELAKSHGVTVIASIHQPSSQVFALFDDLLLLKGGSALYHGPRSAAAHHFGVVLDQTRPADFSAADWLMDLLVQGCLSPAQEERMREEAAAPWPDFGDGPVTKSPLAILGPPRPSWRYEASVLTRRAWRLARGTMWVHEVAFLQVVIGLLSGLLFYRIGYQADDIRARFSASFLLGLNWMFFPLLAALPLVPSAEPMLRKDLQNGAYALSAWFVPATTLALLPDLLMLLVNTPLLYWLAGVADGGAAFVLTLLGQALTILTFQSLGLLIAVGAGSTRANSGTLAMLFMAFCFLFTGIFIPARQMVVPWARFVNPLYYSQCLLARTVFLPGTAYSPGPGGGPPVTRDEALDELGMVTPPGICALVMLGVAVAARLGALVLLQRQMRSQLLVQQADVPARPARAARHRRGGADTAPAAGEKVAGGDAMLRQHAFTEQV